MKATSIYTDRHHPNNYIAKMEDGSYKFVTAALNGVFGAMKAEVFEARLKSRTWDGAPTAAEVVGPEGRILLATLNASLAAESGH